MPQALGRQFLLEAPRTRRPPPSLAGSTSGSTRLPRHSIRSLRSPARRCDKSRRFCGSGWLAAAASSASVSPSFAATDHMARRGDRDRRRIGATIDRPVARHLEQLRLEQRRRAERRGRNFGTDREHVDGCRTGTATRSEATAAPVEIRPRRDPAKPKWRAMSAAAPRPSTAGPRSRRMPACAPAAMPKPRSRKRTAKNTPARRAKREAVDIERIAQRADVVSGAKAQAW